MAEAATEATETITSGGFRIEIGPGLLVVSAIRPDVMHYVRRLNWKGCLLALAFLCWASLLLADLIWSHPTVASIRDMPRALTSWGPEPDTLRWVFPMISLFVMTMSFLAAVFKPTVELRCTSEALEIKRMFRQQVRRKRSYARADVKRIQFSSDYAPWWLRATHASLTFLAEGNPVSCLTGLKSVEAQRILNQLRRMGFDVVQDVALPMAVEMEQSSRKFWFQS